MDIRHSQAARATAGSTATAKATVATASKLFRTYEPTAILTPLRLAITAILGVLDKTRLNTRDKFAGNAEAHVNTTRLEESDV